MLLQLSSVYKLSVYSEIDSCRYVLIDFTVKAKFDGKKLMFNKVINKNTFLFPFVFN